MSLQLPTLLSRHQYQQVSVVRRHSFKPYARIDFHALEAKWKAKWLAREGKVQHDDHSEKPYHPLAPLFSNQLRQFSILESLRLQNSRKSRVIPPRDGREKLLDRFLKLARPKELFEIANDEKSSGKDLEEFISRFGTDIIRTYVVLRSGPNHDPASVANGISEDAVNEIQRLLESIWEATCLAQKSYMISQKIVPPALGNPEDIIEPNSDKRMDVIGDGPTSWAHCPPEEPNILTSNMGEDGNRVWLAAQEALDSMAQPISNRNSLQDIESHLATLASSIIVHKAAEKTDTTLLYHSARILLCLIAPIAPAFAEECWVKLHHGTLGPPDNNDTEIDAKIISHKEVENDLDKDEKLRGVRRHDHTENLPSIFDHPLPVPQPRAVIELLKTPSLLLEVRAKKSSRSKCLEDEREQRYRIRSKRAERIMAIKIANRQKEMIAPEV